jgi:hypothetical protein
MTTPNIDPLDQPVWGADGIAAILNTTPKAVEHLLRQRRLDADKFGTGRRARWVSTPRRLLAQFASKTETVR